MERPIKIALVSGYDYATPGGVNDQIRNLGIQFRKWGHSVQVVAPCSEPHRIDDKNFTPIGRSVPIPTNGSVARISLSIWLRSRIKRFVREQHFDVIHLHEPFSGFVPFSVLNYSQTVNIATFHSYRTSRFYRIGGVRLTMPYFKRLDGRIATSKPVQKFMNKHFPGQYEVIPNGIEPDNFSEGVVPFSHLQDGMINLLFLGRLEKRKGLKYMIAAYSRLKWRYPQLRLLVVGPGTPDVESYRIMSERNLQDVVIVGEVSNEEKARYYKTADIYCSPATGQESFGIVLLEAMAASTPVVASDIHGYSDVITHGKDGLLVPAHDEYGLAESIANIIDNPGLRNSLVANGLEKAQEYRWEQVGRRVMDYYEEFINRNSNS